MGRIYDVLAIWKERGVNVTGKGLRRRTQPAGRRAGRRPRGIAPVPEGLAASTAATRPVRLRDARLDVLRS